MKFNIQLFAAINEVGAGTTNFEVFAEGYRTLGLATVDLPEMNLKGIDIAGPGIAGEMNVPIVGMYEDMELTIHFRRVSPELVKMSAYKAWSLTLKSAQHLYDAANGNIRQEPLKILVRGIPKKLTLGKLEQAAETESEVVLGLDYMKIVIDKKIRLEFDRFNYIYRVRDGSGLQDYFKELRKAVGLRNSDAVTQSSIVNFV